MLVQNEPFENDRIGDILLDGERAGVVSRDDEGEAERTGEPLIDGISFSISLTIKNVEHLDRDSRGDGRICS